MPGGEKPEHGGSCGLLGPIEGCEKQRDDVALEDVLVNAANVFYNRVNKEEGWQLLLRRRLDAECGSFQQ